MKTDKSLGKKKMKFRITSMISIAVVIAIAVFAVLLCYKVDWSYDMTVERLFTLSSQSVKVLDGLDKNVQIAGVYPTGKEDQMVSSLLNQYAGNSEKVSVEYIDIEKEPAKLAAYELNVATVTNGSVIVKCGERSKILDQSLLYEDSQEGTLFNGEREITGAIRYVTSEDLPVVYFVQGNGESNPQEVMTKAVASLEQDAFEIRTLLLTEVSQIPDDAALLVFASPKTDISDDVLKMIEEYTRTGGSVFMMIDAVMNSNEVVYDNLSQLTNDFGIGITNNYVVEQDTAYYLSQYPLYLIPRYGSHEITTQIGEQGKMVILPVVRGLGTIDYDKTEIENTVLLQSSDKSWIRVDMTITDSNKTDKDYSGPAPLAYASVKSNVKWGNPASRMVVIGNSAFALDGNIEVQANRDFFLNCALWLAGDRDTDVISSKAINSGAMIIRGSELSGLAIVCIGVLPGLAFIAAFVVRMIRRNQ